MVLLDWLNQIDTDLFLSINGAHNGYFDIFMSIFTSKQMWVFFYASIIYVFFKKFEKQGWVVLLFCILTIVLCDQFSVLIKNSVERLRPSHQPLLENLVHLTVGAGGSYGFVSSHAANAFGLAVFTSLLFKNRVYTTMLLSWALITCYSRLYVGVHYPLDVLCGSILGATLGWSMYALLTYVNQRFRNNKLNLSERLSNEAIAPVIYALIFMITSILLISNIVLKYKL